MSRIPIGPATSARSYRFERSGRWSGGGQVFLRNVEHAEKRHSLLRGGDGAIPVIARNVPPRGAMPKGPIVLAPQNAWPWTPSYVGFAEVQRFVGLRLASEYFFRRAIGVMRISSSIPAINPNSSPVIHNVLDTGYERELQASLSAEVPHMVAGSFVSLGSMNSYRNLVNLVNGYRAYREAGGSRRLWIAGAPGTSSARAEIERAADTTDGVVLHSRPLSRSECLAALRRAAAVVLPSKVEASPVAALEAAASNPNVILSRIIGHTEILSEYGQVPREALFDPYSPGDIANALGMAESCVDTGTGPFIESHKRLNDPNERENSRVSWGNRLVAWLQTLDMAASCHGADIPTPASRNRVRNAC